MATFATGKNTGKYRLELGDAQHSWNVAENIRDQFRKLRAVICSSEAESLCIGVCSHDSNEGVSWVVSKLACAISEKTSSVIVLDANISRPSQRKLFGISDDPSRPPGFGGSRSRQLLVASPNSATAAEFGPTDLLTTIAELRTQAPFIIMDCEPLGSSAQVMQLAPAVDGVLFVVEAERHRRQVVGRTLELLKRAGIPVLGTVVSKRKQYIPAFVYRML
jgi:Mrp family chromosome partitioning ATPase